MIDAIGFQPNGDMQVFDTQTEQAANILETQVLTLEYRQDLGIDLNYFLNERISFQNESFQAHLVQTLAQWGINALNVQELVESLASQYIINLGPQPKATGLVAR